VKILGRIAADIQIQEEYTAAVGSDCKASLQAIAACYNDSTQCASGSQNWTYDSVHSYFDPYIKVSKVITSQDIPNLFKIGYEVSYQ
jgi:hypothetical protein